MWCDDFGPFDGRVWLNTAHTGPLPRVAAEAAALAIADKIAPRRLRDEAFFEVPARLRAAIARLIGADADDVILGNSASYGLDLLANALPWAVGDEVLAVNGDFPATIFPWKILAPHSLLRLLDPSGPVLEADELKAAIGPSTRLVSVTWVNSFNGHTVDLDRLGDVCRACGVLLVVNVSQALGARLLDVGRTPVDAVTACGHKWMCGPYGTGFIWIRRRLRETLSPRHAYWLPMHAGRGFGNLRDYTQRDVGARAWDVFGTANFFNFSAWAASLEYLLDAKIDKVVQHDQHLVGRFLDTVDLDRYELVSPRSGAGRSTLIVLRPRGEDAVTAQQRLAAAGIDVAVREGALRISPHLHNGDGDIDRAIRALG
jgi:selenocysteine lyase/cysteine desulfurase